MNKYNLVIDGEIRDDLSEEAKAIDNNVKVKGKFSLHCFNHFGDETTDYKPKPSEHHDKKYLFLSRDVALVRTWNDMFNTVITVNIRGCDDC